MTGTLRVSSLLLSIVLCGCGAYGPKFDRQLEFERKPKAGRGTIFVYRTSSLIDPATSRARIYLEEEYLGDVDVRGYNRFDIGRGAHQLAVDFALAFGDCSVDVNIAPGRKYYFLVEKRVENAVASVAGLVTGAVGLAGTAPRMLGIAGSATESAVRECAGAFEISEVPESQALSELPDLRRTVPAKPNRRKPGPPRR